MEVYMNDEHNFYAIVAFDSLREMWNDYNRRIESVRVVLREHKFTEEEIQKLIEASRK